MKIAYAGFDLFYGCLEALERQGCEIIRIFTYKTDNQYEFNRAVVSFAKARGIPWTDARITEEDIEALEAQGCQALISAGYLYRIPVCGAMRCMNVHPALLPIGRGPWPLPVTILRALPESGITVHKLASGFDTGDILLQRRIPLSERETLATLTEKLQQAAPGALADCVAQIDRLWSSARPQGEGEYWPEPGEEARTITPESNLLQADRILRAFEGYGSWFLQGGKRTLIKRGRVVRSEQQRRPCGAEKRSGEQSTRYYALQDGYLEILDPVVRQS